MSGSRTSELRIRGQRRVQVAVALADRFTREHLPVLDLAQAARRKPSTVRRLLAEAGARGDDTTCIGYSDEEITRAIAQRFRQGVSVVVLHRDTGLDERVLRQLLQSAGERLGERHAAPLDCIEDLKCRYEQGASIQELADQVDSSYGTVRRLLLRAGVTLRPRGGRLQPTAPH